jgi:hypothetical protein
VTVWRQSAARVAPKPPHEKAAGVASGPPALCIVDSVCKAPAGGGVSSSDSCELVRIGVDY